MKSYFSSRLFTQDEIDQIFRITLYDVIRMTTNISGTDLQQDVFHGKIRNPSSASCFCCCYRCCLNFLLLFCRFFRQLLDQLVLVFFHK
jgi:hypothetical protein